MKTSIILEYEIPVPVIGITWVKTKANVDKM
jgi:hypothetical protein